MEKQECVFCERRCTYQLCGFWFCFYHRENADDLGASFWNRLAHQLYSDHKSPGNFKIITN